MRTALCGLLLGSACTTPVQPLPASDFDGCDDLRRGPGFLICGILREAELRERSLRFFVHPQHGVLPRVQGVPAAKTRLRPGGEVEVELPLAAVTLPADVTVRVEPRWGTRQVLQLHIERWDELREVAQVSAAIDRRGKGEAREILRRADENADYRQDPAAQARLLNARAELEFFEGQLADAAKHFAASAEQARQTGLYSIAANSARRLAYLHFRGARDIKQAESVLAQFADFVSMIAVEHGLEIYNRGIYARESGHLASAEKLFAHARQEGLRLRNLELQRLSQTAAAEMLAQQGLTQKAESIIAEFRQLLAQRQSGWEPCGRASAYNTLGWARLLMQEARSPGAGDPRELLNLARAMQREDGCGDVYKSAHIEINLARAELVYAERMEETQDSTSESRRKAIAQHLENARARQAQVRKLEPQLDRALRLDHAEISGRLALFADLPTEALRQFSELADEARAAQDPDYLWRALIGQVQANLRLAEKTPTDAERYGQTASRLFAQAEATLNSYLWMVPLSSARRAFIPRFSRGIAAYVGWLIERDKKDEALAVVRRAQLRGLYSTLAFDVLSVLPEPQRDRLKTLRAEFLRMSAALHDELPEPDAKPTTASPELTKLGELFENLKDTGESWMKLHQLTAGEAMFTCYPLPRSQVACFAADPTRTDARIFGASELRISPGRDAGVVVKSLLDPFAAIVGPARVLRILPNGILRHLDFTALEWPATGQYLASEQRVVVYALDLEPHVRAPLPEGAERRAMLLTNLSLPPAVTATPMLFRKLRALGWDVALYSDVRHERGGNLGRMVRCQLRLDECLEPIDVPVPPRLGSAGPVLAALPTTALAQLYTHAKYADETGWQSYIVMPDRSYISVGELLMLEHVPRFTILTTCQGGVAGSKTEVDDISLAQAILLRGGEAVFAAAKDLDPEVGVAWASALYDARPAAGGPGYLAASAVRPLAAYGAALSRLRHGGATARHWSALRLFVP